MNHCGFKGGRTSVGIFLTFLDMYLKYVLVENLQFTFNSKTYDREKIQKIS